APLPVADLSRLPGGEVTGRHLPWWAPDVRDGQLGFSGHSRVLRRAASRIGCASIPARDSAMPNAGHSQTNSSGPAGGSGQAHHRETKECGPPPPAYGYSTGPAGSESRSGLPAPGPPAALPPSENCSP